MLSNMLLIGSKDLGVYVRNAAFCGVSNCSDWSLCASPVGITDFTAGVKWDAGRTGKLRCRSGCTEQNDLLWQVCLLAGRALGTELSGWIVTWRPPCAARISFTLLKYSRSKSKKWNQSCRHTWRSQEWTVAQQAEIATPLNLGHVTPVAYSWEALCQASEALVESECLGGRVQETGNTTQNSSQCEMWCWW